MVAGTDWEITLGVIAEGADVGLVSDLVSVLVLVALSLAVAALDPGGGFPVVATDNHTSEGPNIVVGVTPTPELGLCPL